MRNLPTVIAAVILGLVFLAVGVVYFTHTAGNLPAFFPGHVAGSSAVHAKHGLAAVILGVACFVLAWFQSGPRKASGTAE